MCGKQLAIESGQVQQPGHLARRIGDQQGGAGGQVVLLRVDEHIEHGLENARWVNTPVPREPGK